MTNPVNRVSVARETERKTGRDLTIKGERTKRFAAGGENDSVDISQEARERANGKEPGG